MSAGPGEPEKYSIDEIMDRLKAPVSENPEDGELVTRADGSQAIRVRKRKRRTAQPQKEARQRSRTARIMQLAAALVVLFAALLAAGVAIVYANSSPFRKGLVEKAEQATGAAVELKQFRMNPKTANADVLSLAWPEGNVLKSASLTHLAAEIYPASFLGKNLRGEEIAIVEGSLSLRLPAAGQARRASAPAPDGTSHVDFNRYRVSSFKIAMGDSANPFLSLAKTEASLSPTSVSGSPQLSLYRGDLSVGGWPALKLDRALIVFRGESAEINFLRLHHGADEHGALEFSGSVAPYDAAQEASLAVDMEAFNLAGLVGPELAALISGNVDSQPAANSNYLTFHTAADPAPKMDVQFRVSPSSKIELHGFPFLFGLSEIIDPWFKDPVFDGAATGVFHHEGGLATIRDINFASRDRMALHGQISVAADGALSGTLELGVAPNMIAAASTLRLDAMFGPVKEGYRWLTLRIGGTASAPVDNFKQLFTTTTPVRVKPAAEEEPEGSTFEDLTRPR